MTSARFRALDVTANAQPYWAVHEDQMDRLTIPILGPQRAILAVPVQVVADRRREPRDGI